MSCSASGACLVRRRALADDLEVWIRRAATKRRRRGTWGDRLRRRPGSRRSQWPPHGHRRRHRRADPRSRSHHPAARPARGCRPGPGGPPRPRAMSRSPGHRRATVRRISRLSPAERHGDIAALAVAGGVGEQLLGRPEERDLRRQRRLCRQLAELSRDRACRSVAGGRRRRADDLGRSSIERSSGRRRPAAIERMSRSASLSADSTSVGGLRLRRRAVARLDVAEAQCGQGQRLARAVVQVAADAPQLALGQGRVAFRRRGGPGRAAARSGRAAPGARRPAPGAPPAGGGSCCCPGGRCRTGTGRRSRRRRRRRATTGAAALPTSWSISLGSW